MRLRPVTGATPLAALDAVAIDSETTGLAVTQARIVQLAGIAIALGVPDHGATYQSLVDPRIPIPPSSTAIHGITDAEVRGAPGFVDVLPRFQQFRSGRLLVGHSIGFDLAVIAHEARRAGLPWEKPRTLCIRLLGAIANPNLPDLSLDALAAWLGVSIGGRHTALGDAIAAAAIFTGLTPHLAARGITTLAEAERACLQLTNQLETAHRAGWTEPVTRPNVQSAATLDPYAYSHRVRDLMSHPVVALSGSIRARQAIGLMVERRISSIFVSADGLPDGPIADYGIVTERDILRLLAAHGVEALDRPLDSFASRPLISVAGEAFVYRAIGRMDRLKLRHLAVRDESERLAGVISARDLLRLRAGAAFRLDDAIGAASSAQEMAQAWSTLPSVARSLSGENLDPRLIAGIVSEEIRIMTRRAAELAQAAMRDAGLGGPPCPHALMVLGSGGRGESLLAPDQDNAIVFQDGDPDGPQDRWFADLGSRIADILNTAGIPYCTGGVMAKNAAWRGSLATWRQRIEGWVGSASGYDLLNVDIFFDQRPVYGELQLGADLFDHAYAVAGSNPAFAKLMGEKLFAGQSPFTMLGGVRTIDGRIDLKLHGLFPIVTAARALAIRHDIRSRSTSDRLQGLTKRGLGNAEEIAGLVAAHRVFVGLMLNQQSIDLETGVAVSNKVATGSLSHASLASLKSALKAVQTVPDMVRALTFG